MLATLPTIKARLEIPPVDTTHDNLLTSFILAVSAHFEKKCNRIFARVEFTEEFPADQSEILPAHYPLGVIEAFELKTPRPKVGSPLKMSSIWSAEAA
jgi:hypothetical protein